MLLQLALALSAVPQERVADKPAQDPLQDARLAGHLEAVLERDLGWRSGTFRVDVTGGVATITIGPANHKEREAALSTIAPIQGLTSWKVNISEDIAEPRLEPSHNTIMQALGLSRESVLFPVGDVFSPLIADPKTTQFFASARHYHTTLRDTTGGVAGFGETFGIWRRNGVDEGDGLQVSIAAGLISLFDMETKSSDLVNADYIVGIPLTWRSGNHSVRLRLYHQSSHLGDEFLLDTSVDRVNLSFESFEALYSYDHGEWRGYAGGEYLLGRDPSNIDPLGLHGGLEYRGERTVLFGGRLVGGVDLKSWEAQNDYVNTSVAIGIERGRPKAGARRVRWMLEAYNGYSPHGQFYDDKIWYLGLGLYLAF
jgi:hypothetical protein